MTFTYVDPNNSNRDKVRFLLQDTTSANANLTDEEIAYLLGEFVDVYETAAAGAEIIAGNYAHKADYSKSVGDLSLSETFSSQSERFHQLAQHLRLMRYRKTPATWVANAAALESTDDRVVSTYNTDSYMGQFDNPQTKPTDNY